MDLQNFRDGLYIRFGKLEAKMLIDVARQEIPKLEKKIERIRNHPKNEGQATYSVKIDEVKSDIGFWKEIIYVLE